MRAAVDAYCNSLESPPITWSKRVRTPHWGFTPRPYHQDSKDGAWVLWGLVGAHRNFPVGVHRTVRGFAPLRL